MSDASLYPLRGVRVIDFSWVMAGPMATKMLALMGAEVIKVESSKRPEYARRDGHFHIVNNNKRSCTIDITTPEGQVVVRKLVASSNVLVENFSAGILAKYSLDYDSMRAVRPDLIYISGSGLGRTGPQRDALAYGTLLQAYNGRAKLIGEFNAELEGMGIMGWTDPATATWEVVAMLAAITQWRRTGNGAFVDLSMLESTVALLPEALLREHLKVQEFPRGGNYDFGAAPCDCFRCAGEDEWVALSVRTDDEWLSLCLVMNRPDLAANPEFSDASLRMKHKAALDAEVSQWIRGQDARSVEASLSANGVPAAQSRTISEVIDDPEVRKHDLFPELPDGSRTTNLPWRTVDGWRPEIKAAPKLGADNDYVLGTLLGYSTTEIEKLHSSNVIR
jgi:benzylsuccinate CoA-transferase BbsF subunit